MSFSGKRKRTSFDLFVIQMRKLMMTYRFLSGKFIQSQNLKKTTFFQEKIPKIRKKSAREARAQQGK